MPDMGWFAIGFLTGNRLCEMVRIPVPAVSRWFEYVLIAVALVVWVVR